MDFSQGCKYFFEIKGTASPNLFLTWTLTNRCNYNCNYCLVKKGNSFAEKYKLRIAELNKYSDKIKMIILSGGEPTLHPNIVDIISNLNIDIKLWTNLSQDLDFYINLCQCNPNLKKINTSIHPEQENFNIIFEKINILSNFVEIQCNIMISNINNKNLTNDQIEKINQICKINIGEVYGITNYYKNLKTNIIVPKEKLCSINGVDFFSTTRNKLNFITNCVSCDMNHKRIELVEDKYYRVCHITQKNIYDLLSLKNIFCKNNRCTAMFLRRGIKKGFFIYDGGKYKL